MKVAKGMRRRKVGLSVLLAVSLLAGCGRISEEADSSEENGTDALSITSYTYEIDEDAQTVTISAYEDDGAESITIPESITSDGVDYQVTAIDEETFYNNLSAKEINLPESILTIGTEAFCKCEELTSIEIPGSVVSLGTGLFFDCTSLETVVINEGVVTLPAEIFTNCYALREVQLPDSLTAIGAEAFWGCESLTELTLPESVVSIGDRAFYSSGIQTLTIPSASISLTEATLEGADSLETIYVQDSLVNVITDSIKNDDIEVRAIEN